MRASILLAALLLAGCGGDSERSGRTEPLDEATAAIFAFDRAAPLEATEGETATGKGIVVKGISYASVGGDRVSGIVARRAKAGPKPAGVIFMHGSGGTRADFLDEAIGLARRGAVAVTIDSAFTRSTRADVRAGNESFETTRALMVQTVQDLERGLDLLVDRYGADPKRLAIVGYSMGVQSASLAAALDDRVRALVVMAGRAYPSGRTGDPESERLFGPLDTIHYVGHLAPTAVLFQGGRRDIVIPRAEMEELYAAASEPKEIRWYPTGHELSNTKPDRVAWLKRQLALE
jgi:dienelactone hydrolase